MDLKTTKNIAQKINKKCLATRLKGRKTKIRNPETDTKAFATMNKYTKEK